jgi:transposase
MRKGAAFKISATDRARLEAIVADRNSPKKHVWRAKILLAAADGCGTEEIMRRARVSKPSVWRWQERFMREGVEGLLRDKTRPSCIPPLAAATVERVVELTLTEPPDDATHWTAAAMAREAAISASSVQRIWRARGLVPKRMRSLKLSPRNRAVAAKLRDIVGL